MVFKWMADGTTSSWFHHKLGFGFMEWVEQSQATIQAILCTLTHLYAERVERAKTNGKRQRTGWMR